MSVLSVRRPVFFSGSSPVHASAAAVALGGAAVAGA
jgi:hypothetical protein